MLFDSTLRRDLARSFGTTLVVILTIVLTMLLIRTLGQAAGGKVAPQDVVLLLAYITLGHLPTILALSLFVSVVATLGRMYRDSEMTIWFSSGVGLARFVKPVLAMAWPLLLVVLLTALFAWPWVNQRSLELRDRYEQRSDLSRVAAGRFQTSSDGRRTFFIDRDPEDDRTGRNVFILSRDANSESVTTARRGVIEFEGSQRLLRLDAGQRNQHDRISGQKTLAHFETYRVSISDAGPESVNAPSPRAVATARLLNEPTPAFRGELAWRIGLILAAGNLLLLGVGLAYSNPRRAGSWSLLFALLSFIVYYNLLNLTQAWVASERLSLAAALWTTHGGIFVLAIATLWWREQAIGRPRWRRRPRATA